MPAARFDGRSCLRARASLALALLIPASVATQFNPWMTALFGALLTADLVRYSRALSESLFEFDGSRWWWRRAGDEARPVELTRCGYAGPLLLSFRLEVQGVGRELLLWRWQVRRERWRRLSLASRHGVTGSIRG